MILKKAVGTIDISKDYCHWLAGWIPKVKTIDLVEFKDVPRNVVEILIQGIPYLYEINSEESDLKGFVPWSDIGCNVYTPNIEDQMKINSRLRKKEEIKAIQFTHLLEE